MLACSHERNVMDDGEDQSGPARGCLKTLSLLYGSAFFLDYIAILLATFLHDLK